MAVEGHGSQPQPAVNCLLIAILLGRANVPIGVSPIAPWTAEATNPEIRGQFWGLTTIPEPLDFANADAKSSHWIYHQQGKLLGVDKPSCKPGYYLLACRNPVHWYFIFMQVP